ncbi:MAG: protocatechuate 3,4-dioxygenase subunit alpha [Williamsia herbipolensis]|uniref:Protocatechuate 3,4-dioxygenase alpha subunit n=1 Tax=Williamsia serinedens TaxID=391736 RepID=A0ABT1H0Y0_9NOCA|nr:protocatechuate 3,4-dioxygenase subunit alpha [Williamsia serinedens]MBE7162725.1 protocatechuate 3,4-dioxygenase subunit alpha [Williamsia herbipolensis]MCP2160629.1 protocatechuate 3,4-dioxygenase alpha subunit [Williamsia serinedens]
MSAPTPGQTVGPFFGYALPYAGGEHLVPVGRADAIRLTGRVLDGHGEPVPDALVEIWQRDADGSTPQVEGSLARDGWTFTGFGRAPTDATGRFTFTTLRPGRPTTGGASFIAVAVMARGLLDRLLTRVYLPDDPALDDDPLLSSLPAERRATLIATADDAGYVFDIRLQGADETVFLHHGAAH